MTRGPTKKQVVVYLPQELHEGLRVQAARAGRSMSELVERALQDPRRRGLRVPLPQLESGPEPEAVAALVRYGAPLWHDGESSSLTLEEALVQGLGLARRRASVLRVLPVVIWKNWEDLRWEALLAQVQQRPDLLPAMGMLLELTAEVTGLERPRAWASELWAVGGRPDPPEPFVLSRRGRRFLELARRRTPAVVLRWGYLMATPLQDFQEAVLRFCTQLPGPEMR